jgi:hypothetical protein
MKTALTALGCTLLAIGCASSAGSKGDSDAFVEVRVVDKETGDPAAGARVDYLDAYEIDGRKLFANLLVRFDADDGQRRSFEHTRTDAQGLARIPRSHGIAGVAARLGEKSAAAPVDPRSAKAVFLALEPDKRITVLDARGEPVVDAPLVVYSPDPPPREPIPDDENDDWAIFERHAPTPAGQFLWFGHSNVNGVAEVANWQQLVKDAGAGARMRVCVLGDLFRVDDEELRSDATAGTDTHRDVEPVVVTTESSGSVTVNVRSATGEPASGEVFVEVYTHPEGEAFEADEQPVFGAWSDFRWSDDGRVTFGGVRMGRRLSVSAHAFDGSRRASTFVDGPREAGETVVVDLVLGERLPTLTGRLMDDHGSPLRLKEFRAEWTGSESDTDFDDGDLITDGAGRFRLDLLEHPSADEDGARDLEISLEANPPQSLREWMRRTTKEVLVARVRITHPLEPGDIDLGDIALQRETKPE